MVVIIDINQILRLFFFVNHVLDGGILASTYSRWRTLASETKHGLYNIKLLEAQGQAPSIKYITLVLKLIKRYVNNQEDETQE